MENRGRTRLVVRPPGSRSRCQDALRGFNGIRPGTQRDVTGIAILQLGPNRRLGLVHEHPQIYLHSFVKKKRDAERLRGFMFEAKRLD